MSRSSNEKMTSSPHKKSSFAHALRAQAARYHASKKKDVQVVMMMDPYAAASSCKEVVRGSTGLVFDAKMADHFCPWDQEYVEKPERLLTAFDRCQQLNLVDRCVRLSTRLASDEELLLIHDQEHLQTLKRLVSMIADPDKLEEAKKTVLSQYQSVYINEDTLECTRMAAAATIDLVDSILKGVVQNGMALVRPPGHHAMTNEFCGFCLCNNVAIAARHAIDNCGLKRILIVDWDVHHGQATQQQFYDSNNVLYFSIHRYENGAFWPHLRESNFDAIGSGPGIGHNVNIPLNETGLGDADYMAIFHQVLLPLAYEYSPELVIVSAGFDAAFGCPEGRMNVSPNTYGHLVSSLMALANGKVAIVLEGGYFLPSLAEGVAMCLRSLLGDFSLPIASMPAPKASLVESVLNALTVLKPHWKNLCVQEEYSAQENESDMQRRENIHLPMVVFEGQGLVEKLYSELYDPALHYAKHSSSELATLEEEFDTMKQTYERTLKLFETRRHRSLAIVYDDQMNRHFNLMEPGHPERPERTSSIVERLKEYNLLNRPEVIRLDSRRANEEELLMAHDQSLLDFMTSTLTKNQKELEEMADRLDSIYMNEDSYDCALLSAGSLLQVVDAVCQNEVEKGVAVIRPPGHHAESDTACGFCFFNNVAVAAKYALDVHLVKRILVVDWDVHHGNGIQNIFYDDPRVLYVSLHRYDRGTFFPGKTDANFDFVGQGRGRGFNVNIPWNGSGIGDVEYLLAFLNVILPLAYQFDPELVIVASGFDAAFGDPLGKCKLSPEAYGHMTHLLQSLANGKLIVALEGGYNLNSISYAMTMVVKALLGDPLPPLQLRRPLPHAIESIRDVIKAHQPFWPCLQFRHCLPSSLKSPLLLQQDGPQPMGVMPFLAEATADPTSDDCSMFIPFEYGFPSSTHGVCTLTSSLHTQDRDPEQQMADAKEYCDQLRHHLHTDAENVTCKLDSMSVLSTSWPPSASTMMLDKNVDEYIPSQYGSYASASHVFTFSASSSNRPVQLISTDSPKDKDTPSKRAKEE